MSIGILCYLLAESLVPKWVWGMHVFMPFFFQFGLLLMPGLVAVLAESEGGALSGGSLGPSGPSQQFAENRILRETKGLGTARTSRHLPDRKWRTPKRACAGRTTLSITARTIAPGSAVAMGASTISWTFHLGLKKAIIRIGAQERHREMTFENEMDQFFARNCYSEKDRSRVKACRAYRLAAENNDAIQAQEIAAQVLEGKLDSFEE